MISFLLLLAIQADPMAGPVESWQQASQSKRSSIVRAIVKDCKLAPNSLKVERDGEVIMQPASDTSYEAITCMVERVRRQIGFHKIGIVGNEQVAEEKK